MWIQLLSHNKHAEGFTSKQRFSQSKKFLCKHTETTEYVNWVQMQTSRVNNSRITWIGNAKFSEYCFKRPPICRVYFTICFSILLKK